MNNNFDSLIGNNEIKTKLKFFIGRSKFPNGLLISGESGVGKTMLARLTAKALLCAGDEKPCGECRDCVLFESGNHPDFRELKGMGKSGAILIDAVREVIADTAVIPHRADCKVYLIEQADRMTAQAQNALLKVLEEPPSYVVFILTCLDKSTLLKTVLSRVTELRLSVPSEDETVRYLSERFINRQEKQLRELAHSNDGNIGRCLSALDNDETSRLGELMPLFVRNFTSGTEYELMMSIAPLSAAKDELTAFLKILKELARDALVLRSSGSGMEAVRCISGKDSEAGLLAKKKSVRCLIAISSLCDETRNAFLQNVYYPLLLTDFCAKLWEAGKL